MIEVEVTLKFMKYVRSRYEFTDYLPRLLRVLKCDLEKLGIGPCRRFKYNGVRTYFTTSEKHTLAVESRDALVLFNLCKTGEFDFFYKGPPIVNLEGTMLSTVMTLVNYATLLDAIKNESTFPEIHWTEPKVYDFHKLVTQLYGTTVRRHDEIFKLITKKFKPISQYMRYELDKEICESHRTLVELLFRSLAFKAEWEVKNVREVIEVLLAYPLKHIPRVCESLTTRTACQQTLIMYGAILY
jgi:hypothetical protein